MSLQAGRAQPGTSLLWAVLSRLSVGCSLVSGGLSQDSPVLCHQGSRPPLGQGRVWRAQMPTGLACRHTPFQLQPSAASYGSWMVALARVRTWGREGRTVAAISATSHLRDQGAVCGVEWGGEKRSLREGDTWTKTCRRGRQQAGSLEGGVPAVRRGWSTGPGGGSCLGRETGGRRAVEGGGGRR